MFYSLNLLRRFVSVHDTPANIAKNLTHKSCEIDHVTVRNIPADVVIGKVTEVHKHPNADTLFVCQVDCGAKGSYQICTGGENVVAQSYVPVAIPGCYLPAIDLQIEPRKMRGEASNGMICSKEELGIKEDTDKHWIWNLRAPGNDCWQITFDDLDDKDCGRPLADKYPRLETMLIDVDNKAINNRPDLTGHFGLANELYAIYKKKQEEMGENGKKEEGSPSLQETHDGSGQVDLGGGLTFQALTPLHEQYLSSNIINLLENAKRIETIGLQVISPHVRSYALIKLNDVTVRSSSFYTRVQLLDLGSNPRNNRVDISNLFMNLYGQPVHFFDADTIEGDIIVRQASTGETFVDLFDKTHTLTCDDIVITDATKILALAGVIGGKCSGITDKTKNIAIELGNFDPVSVRKTAQRIACRTDAVMRYEKNINPTRALHLFPTLIDTLKEYQKDLGSYTFAGVGRWAKPDVIQKIHTPTHITIDMERVCQILFGHPLKEGEKDIQTKLLEPLKSLGFTIKKQQNSSDSSVVITVPSRRGPADMRIAEDIYEEIVRLYGYDNIPLVTPPPTVTTTIGVPALTPLVSLIRAIEDTLVRDCRCDQIETYPWVDEEILRVCKTDLTGLCSLQNPLAPETKYLRDRMLYNLLGHVKKNHKFFDELTLFDIGKVWKKVNREQGTVNNEQRTENSGQVQLDAFVSSNNPSTSKPANPQTSASDLPSCIHSPSDIIEHRQLGIIMYRKQLTGWQDDLSLAMKQIIQRNIEQLRLPTAQYIPTHDEQFHPKKQGAIILHNDQGAASKIGFLGQLHPLTLQPLKIDEKSHIFYAEIDLSLLVNDLHLLQTKQQRGVYQTLTDQYIMRDLCFVLPTEETYEPLLHSIRTTTGVQDVNVFDVFALQDTKKSISLTISILGDGSYTTDQINAIMDACIVNAKKAGATLR